jgi:F5/8 type C domain
MLPFPLWLPVVVIVLVWYFTRSTSKSVEPTPEAVVPAATPAAAGNVEFVQKAKYVELKKISSPNPGPADYGGILNVGNIMLYPKGSTAPLPASALTATASSQIAAAYSADKVLDYANPASFWHSKMGPALGEWVRVELKEPMALDHITFLNRADVAGSNVEAVRMLGTQVSILDADSKPIKTYVVTEKSPSYTFAAS